MTIQDLLKPWVVNEISEIVLRKKQVQLILSFKNGGVRNIDVKETKSPPKK